MEKKTMRRTIALWLCVVCLAVLSRPVMAAVQLSGTVYSSGSPVANLTITIKENGAQTKTDPNGRYQFQLEPGAYTLVVRGREFPVKVPGPVTFDVQL
jgi:hypothetical protein